MTDPSKRYWITEQGMKEAAAEIIAGKGRCPICGWTLAESADKGCVIGNCSYRPDWDVEKERLRRKRESFAEAIQSIAAHSEAASAPELEICLMCATGKSEAGIEVREAAWTHIRGEYSWRHPLVADQLMSVECTCPGFVKWTNSLKAGGAASLSHAFSAGMAWQAKLAAAPPQGTPSPFASGMSGYVRTPAPQGTPAHLKCGNEFQLKHGYFCELPKGHEGNHEAQCPNPQFHQSWPQGTPAPEPDKCPECGSDYPKVRFTARFGAMDIQCTHFWHSTVAAQKEKP